MSFATNIESEGECLECIHLEKSNKALRKSIDELKEALKQAKEALGLADEYLAYEENNVVVERKIIEALETINKIGL